MSAAGQIEKKTQERAVKLFVETLGYYYLGDWTDRESNRNIQGHYLRPFLRQQSNSETLFLGRGGRGNHRNFVHPLLRKPITISGNEGDDAKAYQENGHFAPMGSESYDFPFLGCSALTICYNRHCKHTF